MLSLKQREDLEEIKSDLIFLDLSQSIILTKEELEKTLLLIPHLKLKSDSIEETLNQKLSQESIESKYYYSKRVSKNSNTNKLLSNRTLLAQELCRDRLLEFSFLNPIPESMTRLDLNDFSNTEIDWKMLTVLKPKTRLEEDFFTKLVELYQLRRKTRTEDGFGLREAVFRVSRHPRIMRYKPINFKRIDSFGIKTNESSFKINEDISYEAFARVPDETQTNQFNDESVMSVEDILSMGESLDLKLFEN